MRDPGDTARGAAEVSDPDALLERIDRTEPGIPALRGRPGPVPRSVLIVDDELRIAEVTADLLRDAGYDVALAINGKLGLARLAERRTDVVIADVMMPVMGGPAMVREMRADPRFAAIPVILMTALLDAVPAGDAAAHDPVLTKPFRIAEVLATLERLLPPR